MAEHECIIKIDNTNNSFDLILVQAEPTHGSWNPKPPPTIYAGAPGNFLLEANVGIYGAEGFVIYSTEDADTQVRLTFGDPISADNYATMTWSGDDDGNYTGSYFDGSAGSGTPSPVRNGVPPSGSPVNVVYDIVYSGSG